VTPPSATPEAGGRETAPPNVLRGHWLLVARLVWVALAILSVITICESVRILTFWLVEPESLFVLETTSLLQARNGDSER